MLAIIRPDALARLEEVCRRWEVESAVVGRVTAPDADGVGQLRVLEGPDRRVLAEVPATSLADDAPRYERPLSPPADRAIPRPTIPLGSLRRATVVPIFCRCSSIRRGSIGSTTTSCS